MNLIHHDYPFGLDHEPDCLLTIAPINHPTVMDLESTMANRRKAVQDSIRPISIEKLKALEGDIFPYIEHQWREPFEEFLAENSGDTFYHASANEGIQIIYCPAKNRGIWFIPKQGIGHLQSQGLKIMKEVLAMK